MKELGRTVFIIGYLSEKHLNSGHVYFSINVPSGHGPGYGGKARGRRTRGQRRRREEGEEEERLTLLEAQVGDFVDGGAVTVHEAEELIQEQLLLRVREPTAFAAGLHAAHHVLLWRSHTHTHTRWNWNRHQVEPIMVLRF